MRSRLFASRLFVVVAAAAMLAALVAPPGTDAQSAKLIRWPTSSSTAGSGYIYASTVASLANKHAREFGAPVDISVTTSAGVFENERLMKQGQAQIILHSSDEIWNSYKGLGKFDGKANQNLRIMFRAYPSYLNVIASQSSGVKRIEDLKGKRLAAGPPGSVAYTMGEAVLKMYGLTYKDMNTRALGLGEQVSALKDGVVDAIMIIQGIGVPPLKDLANASKVRWLSVEDATWKELAASIPPGYYSLGVLKKGTYNAQDADVNMVGISVIWATTTELDDAVVYAIVKSFFTHKADADKVHPIIRETTSQFAALDLPIPLHAGAARYFKEAGILK
ncbi:MAG: TAXI family TRAP transporter solute-binding subunit [Candidatus Rokubacteria bacterium]|nr:TAXI family TRAP transporter solute-binding subunit [Candidatus Rokubacteria bacterium]